MGGWELAGGGRDGVGVGRGVLGFGAGRSPLLLWAWVGWGGVVVRGFERRVRGERAGGRDVSCGSLKWVTGGAVET